MSNNNIPLWMQNALNRIASIKKEAIDKLPDDELNGVLPGMNASEIPQDAPMPPPPPEPEPDVTGNVFEVDINGVKVKMKLVPELMMKDTGPSPDGTPAQGAPVDPMADTSLNPNADPNQLAQWMSDPATEKPYNVEDKGTVEPLSQEEEGIPVHDTGSENELAQNQNAKVPVHKKPKPKTAAPVDTPGADRSNPGYPCIACANYDAANGTCSQDLDVEKVQARGECSWLNSNFKPFDGGGVMPGSEKDKETYTNDVSDLPSSGGGSGGNTKAAGLKNIWKKI
jgi:hypothetical protein